MPERFSFACFLSYPNFLSPAIAINSAAAAFPDRLGTPIETMVLDVRSGRQETRSWPSGREFLTRAPGTTELLYAYYTSIGSSPGRVSIGFGQSKTASMMTVSLPDMAIANRHDEIAAACVRLYGVCLTVSAACVVAAGGEIDFDQAHETVAEALVAVLYPSSGARWIASDAGSFPNGHAGFGIVRQAGDALILRRI